MILAVELIYRWCPKQIICILVFGSGF